MVNKMKNIVLALPACILLVQSIQPLAYSSDCTDLHNFTLNLDAIRTSRSDDLYLECHDDKGKVHMARTDLRHSKCVVIVRGNEEELAEIQFHEWNSPYCKAVRNKGVESVLLLADEANQGSSD